MWLHRVRRRGRCERLEPDAGKLARPVLRGRGDGNIALLPDFDIIFKAIVFSLVFGEIHQRVRREYFPHLYPL